MSARAALLKGDGEVIAVNDQTLEYVTGYSNPMERVPFTFAPAAISVWFSFFGIKASDVSGDVTFKIISINNVSLDTKDSDYVRITPETINKE
jgi:hypothetical protein